MQTVNKNLNNNVIHMENSMKDIVNNTAAIWKGIWKKLWRHIVGGVLILTLLLCMPFARIDLASGSVPTNPALPAVAPDPVETPALVDGQYSLVIKSSVGILTYYNQSDIRWADHLYGGQDPLKIYGCGPTALAMVVSSFTNHTITPPEMADWAAANNYWSPHSGTSHNFIPECAAAFGMKADSFQNLTVEGVLSELASGHILIALMGPGHFTEQGHFIIIADDWSGAQVRIADPISLENTQQPWELQTILDELSRTANSGGPVWSISPR
ncbi:MAG: hypothetical protein HFG93_12170 [Dorea sp.]|nr:hypothetical protein [Dorea sp.]